MLASCGSEAHSPVSIHPLIPYFEGNKTIRMFSSEIVSLNFFDPEVLLTGTRDGLIQFTFRGNSEKKPKVLRTFSSGEGTIHSVLALKAENTLLSTTNSGKLQVWDLGKGKVKKSYSLFAAPLLKAETISKSNDSSLHLYSTTAKLCRH